MKSNLSVLRHPKFTTNQIVSFFPVITYFCWKLRQFWVSKTLLTPIPQKGFRSWLFPFHTPYWFFHSFSKRTALSLGCRRGSSEDSSTEFTARPFPRQLHEARVTATHLKEHLAAPHLQPSYFSASLQLITNVLYRGQAAVPLALWLCRLLGRKNLPGATNLIYSSPNSHQIFLASADWSWIWTPERVHVPYPVTQHLSHTLPVGQSICYKHRWLRNNSADRGKLCIRWGKSLWLSLWCFFPEP